MEYGCKWDHKLNMWVVYVKKTGKIVYKSEICEDAEKYQRDLLNGTIKLYRKR